MEWYDDKPMFENCFERLVFELNQVASSMDNLLDKQIELLMLGQDYDQAVKSAEQWIREAKQYDSASCD